MLGESKHGKPDRQPHSIKIKHKLVSENANLRAKAEKLNLLVEEMIIATSLWPAVGPKRVDFWLDEAKF